MSFDISFMSCRTSGTEEKEHPFSGEVVTVPVSGPLTPKERKQVNLLLTSHEYDSAVVQLAPDVYLEVSVDDNRTGGMIFLRNATPAEFQFLYDLADAGSYILCPVMEGNPWIATSHEALESGWSAHLDPGTAIHVVNSPLDLAEIIYPAFGDWDAYRRRVVDGT